MRCIHYFFWIHPEVMYAAPVSEVGPVTIAADYISAPPSFPDITLNTSLAKLFCSNATELHDQPVAVSPATYDRQVTFQHPTEIMTGRGGGGGRRVLLPPCEPPPNTCLPHDCGCESWLFTVTWSSSCSRMWVYSSIVSPVIPNTKMSRCVTCRPVVGTMEGMRCDGLLKRCPATDGRDISLFDLCDFEIQSEAPIGIWMRHLMVHNRFYLATRCCAETAISGGLQLHYTLAGSISNLQSR